MQWWDQITQRKWSGQQQEISKFWETIHTRDLGTARKITETCLKQHMFNKHTNKVLFQVPRLILFLTILMQTEELLAHDRHQKIFGPANTHLMCSYFEVYPDTFCFHLGTWRDCPWSCIPIFRGATLKEWKLFFIHLNIICGLPINAE